MRGRLSKQEVVPSRTQTDSPRTSHAQLNWHARACPNLAPRAQEACQDSGKEKKPEKRHGRGCCKRNAGPRNPAKSQIHCNIPGRRVPAGFPTHSEQSQERRASWCVSIKVARRPWWSQGEQSEWESTLQGRQDPRRFKVIQGNSRVNLSKARTVLPEGGRLKKVCGGGRRKMPCKPQAPQPSPHPSEDHSGPFLAELCSGLWVAGQEAWLWGVFLFPAGPKGHTRRQEMKERNEHHFVKCHQRDSLAN